MDRLTELFCLIDDFCQDFEPEWEQRLLTDGQKKRRRPASLSFSERMTLAVLFHQLRYRQFKSFYFFYALRFLRSEFPVQPACRVEHTRHRSHANSVVNLMSDIIAYCLTPNKSRLSIRSCAPTCQ